MYDLKFWNFQYLYELNFVRIQLDESSTLDKNSSPENVFFRSEILDCFPEADSHPGCPVPEHIGQFAFPEGFCLSLKEKPPTMFTFVLTNTSGIKVEMYIFIAYFWDILNFRSSFEIIIVYIKDYEHFIWFIFWVYFHGVRKFQKSSLLLLNFFIIYIIYLFILLFFFIFFNFFVFLQLHGVALHVYEELDAQQLEQAISDGLANLPRSRASKIMY